LLILSVIAAWRIAVISREQLAELRGTLGGSHVTA
jgi:hypothetical protein